MFIKFKENEDKHEPLDKIEQGKLIGYTVLSYLFPIIYNIYISIKNRKYNLCFKLSILMILITIIGGGCYSFRIPDIYFKPGTFNKIGSSHNNMHFFLILMSICEVLYVYVNAKEGNYIKSFK